MISVKLVASSILFFLCCEGALKFKALEPGNYAGVNSPAERIQVINNIQDEPDNVLCHSQKVIGIVDGESPIADGYSLTPKHLSKLVANEIFLNKANLFAGAGAAEENHDEVKLQLKTVFKNGMIHGMDTYRQNLAQLADLQFYQIAANVPKWDIIFKAMDAEKRSQAKKLMDLFSGYANQKGPVDQSSVPQGVNVLNTRAPQVTQAFNDFSKALFEKYRLKLEEIKTAYLGQITTYQRKINAGLAVITGRLINVKVDKSITNLCELTRDRKPPNLLLRPPVWPLVRGRLRAQGPRKG